MSRGLVLSLSLVASVAIFWMLFGSQVERLSSKSSEVAASAPPSLPTTPLPPYRSGDSDPSEAALAESAVLEMRLLPGEVRAEWIRESLVRSKIQPRPLKVVEKWHFDQARNLWALLKREIFLADQVMVRAVPGTSAQSLSVALDQHGMSLDRHLGEALYTVLLPTADLDALPQALEKLNQMKSWIFLAEADGVGFGSGIPNDPSFSTQWGLHNTGQSGGMPGADMNAVKLWEIIRTAPDVVIAVLDSGLNFTHPDLQGVAWNNPGEIPGDTIDNDGNGRVDDLTGWDFVNNDNDPTDDHGHGSHVTGIICANRDNGVGVTGVLSGVKILTCKILNASNSGLTSNLIAATIYSRLHGVPIMNLSLQNYPNNSTLNDEFSQCAAAGILLCICAGNQGVDNDVTPNYPSSYTQANIISVGNHDRTDVRWSGSVAPSNYGLQSVDLFAPGREIRSPILGTSYSNYTGTSMSTPFVAAVAAAIKQLHPHWQASSIKTSIVESVTLRAAYDGICTTGGRLDGLAAVAHAVKQEPQLDRDGDGYSNYFEYAAGTRMDSNDARPELSATVVGDTFRLALPHANRDDLMIWVERFVHSGHWLESGITDLSSSGLKAGSIPLDGSAGQLLRIHIADRPSAAVKGSSGGGTSR